MPGFPIVDAHLHLWDPVRVPLSWQQPGSLLARPYGVEDYARDCGPIAVEAMVFVECDVDAGGYEEEIVLVEENRRRDPRIGAIVCKAPVEQGPRVLDFLGPLAARHPLVTGVRRLIEFDPDPELCIRPAFIEGVRSLAELGLTFDVNVHHTQLQYALQFARAVDNVPLMLDHCGKPPVLEGALDPWRGLIRELARLPNVHCKLSDLPVEANREHWTAADVRPYIDTVVEAFGFDRLVFGGDWPVCLQATTLARWIGVLDEALHGCTNRELHNYYRDNARRFYRLTATREPA